MKENAQSSGVVASGQVTSEEILKSAFDSKNSGLKKPLQTVQDLDELRSLQLIKRKEYEQQLNKNRLNLGQWLRYAKWEINHNHDFARARSIFERALEVNVEHIPFWTHYIQLELVHKNVNHARNLLDRATTTLPMVAKLWFIYVQTEETLKNYGKVRQVFERWLEWRPVESAWDAFINFETRYDEYNNARDIFVRYVQVYPQGETWLKWIKFEQDNVPPQFQTKSRIRSIFEASVDSLLLSAKHKKGDAHLAEILGLWASWEQAVGEHERAKSIFTVALADKIRSLLTPEQTSGIYEAYSRFERIHGFKDDIESSVLARRKLKYQELLKTDPTDYDTWWLYLSCIEQDGADTIRLAFQTATSVPPQDKHKSIKWRRYILLWIKHAYWEEFSCNHVSNARKVWTQSLEQVPHHQFTFAKLWRQFAEFELRNDSDGLTSARKILGRSIGQTCGSGSIPKHKIFSNYIELETRLAEWNRVRKLYEKWLEVSLLYQDSNCAPILLYYIDFERSINEIGRCQSLYQLGLQLIDENEIMAKKFDPEHLWYSYINFLKEEMMYEEARAAYNEFVEKYCLTKVWVSYAMLESSIPTASQLEQVDVGNEDEVEFDITDEHRHNTRKVFERAVQQFKVVGDNDSRATVLQAWRNYEELYGSDDDLRQLDARQPVQVKRTRMVDGVEEEFLDYIFPDDEEKKENETTDITEFLANAKQWLEGQS